MSRNVFVIGLDDFNRRLLERVRGADDYRFHGLLDVQRVAGRGPFDVPAMRAEAAARLEDFAGAIDAVVGFWDFPTQLLLALLRRDFKLVGPSLEAVLRCEHKYWARLEQQAVAPDVVPDFAWLDPFDADANRPPLPFPFWLKPVKAHSSLLGFHVGDRAGYRRALATIRRGIHVFAEPLGVFLAEADLPGEIAGLPHHACIAEQIVSRGRQCTLEGYVRHGRACVYGTVDSVRGPNRSSFSRYEFPSQLPQPVQARMRAIAGRVVEHAGLDDTPFNIEFYYEEAADRLWLLEVNVRISKSHSPLFEKVTGIPHNEVMIDVALDRDPDYPPADGRFRHAAKFMPRHYGHDDDAVVTKVPSPAEIAELEARFPGTDIQMHLEPGMRLGDIRHRDSYSYELATIFMGADSRERLMADYRRLWQQMDIRIEETPA